jgi:2-polyprenyl-6-methoxyphenol hydroxylase-like FAD-dependent oxidoreductase
MLEKLQKASRTVRKRRLRMGEPEQVIIEVKKGCPVCYGAGVVPKEGNMPPPSIALPTIAIAGGGVGGLALALALQIRGWTSENCIVYERDTGPTVRRAGYALTMQQGSNALRHLGADQALRQAGISSFSHWVFDSSNGHAVGCYGRSLYKQSTTVAATDDKRCNVHLSRRALQQLLLERLLPGTVRWGCKVEGLANKTKGAGVNYRYIRCKTGEKQEAQEAQEETVEAEAAILVAADGVRASVLRSCGVAAPLRRAGAICVLGILNQAQASASSLQLLQVASPLLSFTTRQSRW